MRSFVGEVRGRREPSTIHYDVGSGDVRGLVTGQEQGRVGNLLRLAAPAFSRMGALALAYS